MMGFVLNLICPMCGARVQAHGCDDYEDRPIRCPRCHRKTLVVNTNIHTEYKPILEEDQ